ncbi:MAG: glutathione S-transferase N-terminal domain-containing protein [Limnobacter sp.]|nr:glutathione S-transferase N-terminal domain-containing protein [Limnobacter sp.]
MSNELEAVIHLVSGTARGWRGANRISQAKKQPEKLLKLYDIEASPFCRLVREVLSEMDVDVMILPCPAGGKRFRPEAKALLSRVTFPLLVDDNTGDVMIESSDIIEHLGRTYHAKVRNSKGVMRGVAVGTSVLSTLLGTRPSGIQGLKARPSKAPQQPLELYSFEASPYSKPVRARLCELEIPYILRNTPKAAKTDLGPPFFRDKLFKGPKGTTRHRQFLADTTGMVQVPYLVDPNTGVAMYESADIVKYLDKTYGA